MAKAQHTLMHYRDSVKSLDSTKGVYNDIIHIVGLHIVLDQSLQLRRITMRIR